MTQTHAPGVIQFDGYRIFEVQYHCPPTFEFNDHQYHMNVTKTVSKIDDHQVQIDLLTKVYLESAEQYESSDMQITLGIAGRFSCQNSVWDTRWENNAIAIMFPYARSIITSITAQTGRTPVILPTLNVSRMFQTVNTIKETPN